ncbi:MAG TPA: glycosyltransferase family 1 protein [Bacteroidetes bacterium]|jgi:glycosyltransferase involved in cell wall biosynthesis|nr:glycosyltransferase family 1 protein [Bacteroidota bacterium]|tara:strand:- start:10179 stop:11225 length:1047 start_codon:yes stop_codon:yes gene_type:complete
MKIGFDAKRYFNNTTGLGNYARWLINSLPQDQIESILYQPKNTEESSFYPISYPKSWHKWFPSLWRSTFICAQLQNEQIDIYHGLSNELPFGIHKLNLKTVVTIHDLINLRYPENYRRIDRFFYKKKLTYAQKYATKIIVPSEQTKNDLLRYFNTDPSKIQVIPLSLPKPVLATQTVNPSNYILCVSGFSKRKNLEMLLDAYKHVPGTARLLLVGKEGDTFKRIQKKAKEDDRIELKQNVTDKELSQLYSDALFCIYPSLFEGFGLPILEAFQHGKTVATSNISSMPEVGGNAATYFDPHNIASVKEALEFLFIESNRKQNELEIPKQLALFNSNDLINKYIQLYKSL